MKSTTLAITAISLLQLAAAQPHRVKRHVHEHQNAKKDVVVTVIDTVYAQATEVPEVIIYVNQNGNPLSTVTEEIAAYPASVWTKSPPTTLLPSYTPSPVAVAASSTSSSSSIVVQAAAENTQQTASVAITSSTPVAVAVDSSPAVAAPPAETSSVDSSSSSTSSSSSQSESSGYGVAYSPYNNDTSCKNQAQVTQDINQLGSQYSLVRIYGTDCDQTNTVLTAIRDKPIKLFAGIYDLSDLSGQVELIANAANGNWTGIDTVSVGNELVNSGAASADAVVAAIGTVRGLLQAKGYTGKVVTVDTLVAAKANPKLCDASDYCAVNCHPFYDGNTVAEGSGAFLTTQIPTLAAVLANKNQEIVITETGWPWQGSNNNVAVPSLGNQELALSSIKKAFQTNPSAVILFTAFNDWWKSSTVAQFQAEKYWGIGGTTAPSDISPV